MRKFLLHLTVIAVVSPALVLTQTVPAPAGDAGAAIAGGVVGMAVGAALSAKHRHNKVIVVPGYQPLYPPGGYPAAWGQSFSPQAGIICYSVQHACYDAGGAFNPKWTSIIF